MHSEINAHTIHTKDRPYILRYMCQNAQHPDIQYKRSASNYEDPVAVVAAAAAVAVAAVAAARSHRAIALPSTPQPPTSQSLSGPLAKGGHRHHEYACLPRLLDA